jgi:hypothetical protein
MACSVPSWEFNYCIHSYDLSIEVGLFDNRQYGTYLVTGTRVPVPYLEYRYEVGPYRYVSCYLAPFFEVANIVFVVAVLCV